ncbi:hypothetical protein CBR_g30323 [Chara braunii]|uniref:DUF6816 domain-containing protein n=1 Tax=Chara braunii TaxID=69332 RepID=A0A388JX44_CHABU|nr:hypothetical protein CBR_g30323 [Chara braunii]|eukprot:GBG62369.1 hypothetical protein CBR_g30323 [Chara braunii]
MSLSPCNSSICDGGYGFCQAPLSRGHTCRPRQQEERCHRPPHRHDIRTGRQVLGGLVAKERGGGKTLPHGQAVRPSGQRRCLLSSCSLSSGEQPVGFRDGGDPMCLQSGDHLLAQAVAGDAAANGLVLDWRRCKTFLRSGKSLVSRSVSKDMMVFSTIADILLQFKPTAMGLLPFSEFSEFSEWSSPAHYSRTVRMAPPPPPPPPRLAPSCTRRSTLLTIAAGLAMQGGHASASSEESLSVGSQILRGLGLGDPDIYYPRVFQGTWDCFSTLVSVDTPQAKLRIANATSFCNPKDLG